MRCAPRASNGPDHLGLCARQADLVFEVSVEDENVLELGESDVQVRRQPLPRLCPPQEAAPALSMAFQR